jgi:hypothetical protein
MTTDSEEGPSRDEVRKLLSDLVSGKLSREQASEWAGPWMTEEAGDVTDEVVWNAIDLLYSADSATGPGQYLYGPADFQTWLDEFNAG